jgi:hypothetical protein
MLASPSASAVPHDLCSDMFFMSLNEMDMIILIDEPVALAFYNDLY